MIRRWRIVEWTDLQVCWVFLGFTVLIGVLGIYNLYHLVIRDFGTTTSLHPTLGWGKAWQITIATACIIMWIVGAAISIRWRKLYLMPILAIYVLVIGFYCIGPTVNKLTLNSIKGACNIEDTRPVVVLPGDVSTPACTQWKLIWLAALIVSMIIWAIAIGVSIWWIWLRIIPRLRFPVLAIVLIWSILAPAATSMTFSKQRLGITGRVWVVDNEQTIVKPNSRLSYPAFGGFAAGLCIVFALGALAYYPEQSVNELKRSIRQQEALLGLAILVMIAGVIRLYLSQRWMLAGIADAKTKSAVVSAYSVDLIFVGLYYMLMFFFAFLPTILLSRLRLESRLSMIKDEDERKELEKFTITKAVERLILRLIGALSPMVIAVVQSWTFP